MQSISASAAERSPRKVLHVFNSATGGAAVSTIRLIEFFQKRGIESCAVCHTMGSQTEKDLIRDTVRGEVLFTPLYWWNKKHRARLLNRPIIELRQWLATGGSRSSARRVAEFAAEHHADLIHTNTFVTPEGGMAAMQLGLPHVWHVRELVGPGTPYRLGLEGPALGRYLQTHCSKLVANAYVTASKVKDWVPADMLEIVPNGIDMTRFTPRFTPAQSDRVIVAMVGNLTSRNKDHALFVEAAALVNRSLSVEFRIYGHDPSDGGRRTGDRYTNDIYSRIRGHALSERFHCLGWLSRPAEIMSQIDILVHPTDTESFGRIAVEAMATGLPVVGVRGGGVGEIVQHEVTGLLAEVGNVAEMARHIERLVRDAALREKFGRAGLKHASENYTLDKCGEGIARVYQAAMRRPLSTSAARPTSGDPANIGS